MLHYIFKKEISFPEDDELEAAIFGMGCFWGAEKKFWERKGVKLTAVGYAGGSTQNPSYRDVCTGLTGHNEVVKVLFDPSELSYLELLSTFWENHDPTQLNRQGINLNNIPTMAGFGVDDLAIDGVRATKELFKASGSKILKTKVKEIICDSNNVTGVKTDDEIINDNEVILTAGLGAPKLLSTINIPFEMHSSLGLLVYTKPLPQLLKYPITGFDFHARQDDKGRLIIGGKFDDDSSQEENIKGTAKKLIQDMATRLNYNGNMILDHFTLGKRPLPVDGRPKIGRLINQKGEKLNGIYLAVMHSGITNAPLAGKFGIDEVLSGKRNYLIRDFSPQKTDTQEEFPNV